MADRSLATRTDLYKWFLPSRPLPRKITVRGMPLHLHDFQRSRKKYPSQHDAVMRLRCDLESGPGGVRTTDHNQGNAEHPAAHALTCFLERFEAMAREFQDIVLAGLELRRENMEMKRRLREIAVAWAGEVNHE
ncbi:MAG: hypothetical protein HQK81_07510 [Desulfovibrionaceae bacterium]|nr:hypothetical protein [Desulfovibrionaceae bacterium]MBF0513897.1 hypothetical protein [Desulfovibrionaceae bacterium]